jgi:hypothetical protein
MFTHARKNTRSKAVRYRNNRILLSDPSWYMVQKYTMRLLHPLLYRPIIGTNDRLTYFHAGHQMYVHIPSLEKLSALAAEFFGVSASGGKNDQW